MNYARFMALGRPVWDRFASRLASAERRLARLDHDTVEGLAFDYRRVLHDLALARARFPGTEAARLLSSLALHGTRLLVFERRTARSGPLGFFLERFPAVFRREIGTIGLAAALLVGFGILGFVAAAFRPELGQVFLGPEAVRRLADGHLWTESLTTTVPPQVSSSLIAANNLSAALFAWTGGALAGFGSLYAIALNGVLLGSLFALTAHYSAASDLAAFVVAHGVLELTVFTVAAAGGLMMARGIVAPGDRPRGESLADAAKDAAALLGGCLPWLVPLALVEAFVSPRPDLPVGLKIAVGLALEASFLALALGALSRGRHA